MTDEPPIAHPLRFDASFPIARAVLGCGSDARYEDDVARWRLTGQGSISIARRPLLHCAIALTDGGSASRPDFGRLLLPIDGDGASIWLDLYPSQWPIIVQAFMTKPDALVTIHATTSMDAATEEEAFAARIVVFGVSIALASLAIGDGSPK